MYTKISTFSDIILGYNFRSAIEEDITGNVSIIQAKNIVQDHPITHLDGLPRVSLINTRTSAILQKKDILIVSRGTGIGSFRATIFDIEKKNAIASWSILIVRVKKPEIIPEYLCLYLNSEDGQKKILETISWATIHTISPKKFSEIGIPIIPLIKQKNMVWLHQNIIQQEKIYNRKKELKQEILTATLKNIIHS